MNTLTDAAIQQVKWDPSKVRDKLKRDIEAHLASVRAEKLSELCGKYEVAPFFKFICLCHSTEHRILV